MSADSNEDIGRSEERIRDLMNRKGIDWPHAANVAWLEKQICEDWPTTWGDDFQILIYGDFDPPEQMLRFPELGITVQPEKLENTVIRSAGACSKRNVEISEKTLPAILDATRRINILLALGPWSHGQRSKWLVVTYNFRKYGRRSDQVRQ